MGREDEITLEVINNTHRIVAAFDQQEKYHDIFPQKGNIPHEATLSADYHRSYKICAPAQIYTLFFLKRNRTVPIAQLCTREVGQDYRSGPVPDNKPVCELELGSSRIIIATISDAGYVRLTRKK